MGMGGGGIGMGMRWAEGGGSKGRSDGIGKPCCIEAYLQNEGYSRLFSQAGASKKGCTTCPHSVGCLNTS